MTWLALLYRKNKSLKLKQGKISAVLSGLASESRVSAAGLCLPPPALQSGHNIKWEEMVSAGVAAANT